MITWFKKKVISWVREDWNKTSNTTSTLAQPTNSLGTSRRLEQNGMNFTLYSATGGYVMEYIAYDERTDERNITLHIIPSEQDLGQGIAHIITLECLRK
jgi:hypothetical protein